MTKSNKTPRVSESEWAVLRVIWESPEPLTAKEIVENLTQTTDWQPKTVRSFLNRLVTKGVLTAEKRTFRAIERLHYFPKISREELLAGKRSSLLARFFGGTVRSMLAGFIDSGDLTEEDLAELRSMIDAKMKGDSQTAVEKNQNS